jgi:hypothetical protein
MKRKISIVLVLAVCLSICFSSVAFADNTYVSGYAGSAAAYGNLSWNSTSASSSTGSGGSSYVYTRVQFCYQWGDISYYYIVTNSATGSYGIGATATAQHTPISRTAARAEHMASNANGTWHPAGPNYDYWATWIGTWPV